MFAINEKEINDLVRKEREKAVEKWGLHNSQHEKYAVIKEEVEEASTNMDLLKDYLEEYWRIIKQNGIGESDCLEYMRKEAMRCILELIQVIAMIDKEIKNE